MKPISLLDERDHDANYWDSLIKNHYIYINVADAVRKFSKTPLYRALGYSSMELATENLTEEDKRICQLLTSSPHARTIYRMLLIKRGLTNLK